MQGGHGASRKAVMHNDFIVAGPADDPAKVKDAASAAAAFSSSRRRKLGSHLAPTSRVRTRRSYPCGMQRG